MTSTALPGLEEREGNKWEHRHLASTSEESETATVPITSPNSLDHPAASRGFSQGRSLGSCLHSTSLAPLGPLSLSVQWVPPKAKLCRGGQKEGRDSDTTGGKLKTSWGEACLTTFKLGTSPCPGCLSNL